MTQKAAKQSAAATLHANGYAISDIARALGVGRQTVRRWIVPGERERHNAYIAAGARRRYVPDVAKGRCKQDTVGMDARIEAHKRRIQRENSCEF